MINNNLAIEKQNIINLFNEKKFSKISKISPKILSFFIDEPDIVKIIVFSNLNTKNFIKAEKLLRKVLIRNNTAEYNYILGNTLKIQDKNDDAIIAYKKSISLNNNFSEAYNNLANVQKKIGDFDNALLNYKNAIRTKEDNFEAYYNLANLLKTLKNYDEANKNYKKAVKLNPNFSDAYNNIGTIYSILGNFNDSQKFFIKSMKINKYFAEPYKNYVQSCKISEKDEVFNNLKEIVKKEDLDNEQKEVFFYSISKAYFDNALLNYKNAIRTKEDNFEAYYNLANLLKTLKNYDEANKNYKKAVKLNPNFSDAYNNIGTIYSILGNFNDAQKFFIKSIKINKYFAEPYKNYVQSCKISEKDEVFNNLKEIVKKEDLDNEQKEVFFYSISKAYFDVENNELAFKYLNSANNLKLTKLDYSFNKDKKEFKKIKEFFSKKELMNLNLKENGATPIFILGMPRSGTSLIEQIVSNHSEVHGAGELNLLPISVKNSDWQNSVDFEEVSQKIRKEYLEKISLISNKKYITDKLPGNFKRIGFILNAFPESKIIHLQRNPMAICWSNYKSNFNSTGMAFTLNQEYTAEYYLLYKNLMKFWNERYSEKIINVNYENLVENFEEEVKKLFSKINLNWEKQLYDFHKNKRPVETASFMQVRSKIYKKSSEKWKSYKKYLTSMTDILSANNVEF